MSQRSHTSHGFHPTSSPEPTASPAAADRPVDRLGRPLHDLRISLTDRCNLRCPYCMPAEVFGPDHAFLPTTELLTFDEIERVARVAASLGVVKLRLTGGEPTLRAGLAELVARLARVPGIEDLALTTNGLALARLAAPLAAAGLRRVTVSLDSLEPATATALAGRPLDPARVVAGIDAARAAGLPVKLNTVVRRGANEHELPALAAFARGRDATLRCIEFMDVGNHNGWNLAEVVPAREMLAAIDAAFPLEPVEPAYRGEVARRYRYRDGRGEVGFITSISQPFCGDCTRARLSADGKVFTCLFAALGKDIRPWLRGRDAVDDATLRDRLARLWRARADRYSEQRASLASPGHPPPPKAEMSYLGG